MNEIWRLISNPLLTLCFYSCKNKPHTAALKKDFMSQILADTSKEMAACYTEKPVTGENSSKRKMFHCDFFVKITL